MYLLESPRYTKGILYEKKKYSKESVTDALDGSYQVSSQQQIRFYSKIFGNKHCRYNEGPLYKSLCNVDNSRMFFTIRNKSDALMPLKQWKKFSNLSKRV